MTSSTRKKQGKAFHPEARHGVLSSFYLVKNDAGRQARSRLICLPDVVEDDMSGTIIRLTRRIGS